MIIVAIHFLCHDRNFDEEVVIKTLHSADLDRNLLDVTQEARLLKKLKNDVIINVQDVNYVDPKAQNHAYIVMDYFPGGTLEQFVEQRGVLCAQDFVVVARQISQGMLSAHKQGILHRDLKPANILVRKEGKQWRVRIIDFGLALRRSTVETSMAVRSHGETILSSSVAGTMKFAPPEQRGDVRGVMSGIYSDVYAFGKTCCFALFKTTEPRSRHWQTLPEELRDLLERCIDEDLHHRCQSFDEVLDALDKLARAEFEEGKKKLRLLVLDIYRRTNGKPTNEDNTASKALVKRYGLPADQAKQIISEAKQQWRAEQKGERDKLRRQQEEKVRNPELSDSPREDEDRQKQIHLQEEGERKLREFLWACARMTGGTTPAPETMEGIKAAVLEIHEQYQLKDLRMLEIVSELWENWENEEEQQRDRRFFTNSLGMKLVFVPKGTFWMSKDGKNAQRQVEIEEDFYMGVYQVTQGQWEAVMGNNPSDYSRHGNYKDQVKHISDQDLRQFPVEGVSWNDTQNFIEGLNEIEQNSGRLYRLPTEAEWEYSCRAAAVSREGCSFDFYLFDKDSNAPMLTNDLSSYQANFCGNRPFGKARKGPDLARPTKVGSYQPNALGLYDMHGNVSEWCEDWYDGNQDRRVLRGGSFSIWNKSCRAADRIGLCPGSHNVFSRLNGFRVACSAAGRTV